MINILVVTHGEFGAYLVEAAEDIVGRQSDGVKVVSLSVRLGMEEMRRRITGAIDELKRADGLVVATDMPGGTPSNLVLPLVKDRANVMVVSGLNLYMLVSAFGRRREASLTDLTARMLADGQRSIRDMKVLLTSAQTH